MKNISELVKSVEEAGHEIYWLGSVTEDQLLKLEKNIGFLLPPSFRRFLGEYGGGGIIGSDISGIEDNDASLENGGTVYGDTLEARAEYDLPEHFAVVLFAGDEICWCLDSSVTNSAGEYPVVSYNLFQRKIENKLANDFFDFLVEQFELRLD